jgi:hypothetical protein
MHRRRGGGRNEGCFGPRFGDTGAATRGCSRPVLRNGVSEKGDGADMCGACARLPVAVVQACFCVHVRTRPCAKTDALQQLVHYAIVSDIDLLLPTAAVCRLPDDRLAGKGRGFTGYGRGRPAGTHVLSFVCVVVGGGSGQQGCTQWVG